MPGGEGQRGGYTEGERAHRRGEGNRDVEGRGETEMAGGAETEKKFGTG